MTSHRPNVRSAVVERLTQLSLTELRRRQHLNAEQIRLAHRQGNTDALEELLEREGEYDAAIDRKEFGGEMHRNHRAEHLSRPELGELMLHWHSSQGDPIYMVGSYYVGGNEYPDPSVIEEAKQEFERLLSEHERMLRHQPVMVQRQGRQVDLRKFAGYKDRELKENISELREILFNLDDLIEHEDYGHLSNAGYYVWPMAAGSTTPLVGEGPFGPYDYANARTTARIRATNSRSHDYAVSRGRDPEARGFEIERVYKAGSGEHR